MDLENDFLKHISKIDILLINTNLTSLPPLCQVLTYLDRPNLRFRPPPTMVFLASRRFYLTSETGTLFMGNDTELGH